MCTVRPAAVACDRALVALNLTALNLSALHLVAMNVVASRALGAIGTMRAVSAMSRLPVEVVL